MKVKKGILSIFIYVVAQLIKAWHHDDIIKTCSRYHYQNNASIIIAYSVDFIILIFSSNMV